MSFLKNLKSRFRRRSRLVDDGYQAGGYGKKRSFPKIIANICMFPIRVLFLPFSALGLFHDTGVKTAGYGEKKSLKKRVATIGKSLLQLPIKILAAPAKLIQAFRKAKTKDALFALPAILMIVFLGFVFVQVFARGSRIENRYLKGAQDAFKAEDFELAKTYFKRILSEGTLTRPRSFQWFQILAETNESARAEQVLNQLAPDDSAGYGPAHRIKALVISSQLQDGDNDVQVLTQLRNHLENSDDTSPQIQQAWANYYYSVENYPDAIAALKKAAVANPIYYQDIANIYKQQGSITASNDTLKLAEKEFEKLLQKDELNHAVRVRLASVKAELEDSKGAENLLQQGIRIQPDPYIRRAMSQFYVMQHDLARKDDADVATQMDSLMQAINFDPNFSPVYDRMLRLFLDAKKSPEDSDRIEKAFQAVVTSENPTPLAHFALSNILWQKNELTKAKKHLEQANLLGNDIGLVMNNLAWMIAHSDDPDLERALNLATTAVEQNPKNGQFRDTLGTVYFKQSRYQDAVVEFQRSLKDVRDKAAVHQKMVVCYENLGMDELAASHRKQAEDLK